MSKRQASTKKRFQEIEKAEALLQKDMSVLIDGFCSRFDAVCDGETKLFHHLVGRLTDIYGEERTLSHFRDVMKTNRACK